MKRKLIGGILALTTAFGAGYAQSNENSQDTKQHSEQAEQPYQEPISKSPIYNITNKKEIEELIKQRIKEARDKDLINKAKSIYVYVSEDIFGSSIKKVGPFEISSGSETVRVKYNNQVIFHGTDRTIPKYKEKDSESKREDSIYIYIPGEWEKEFEQLYQQSLEEEKAREDDGFRERAKAFGLEDKLEQGESKKWKNY